jgi:hypothetical protein
MKKTFPLIMVVLALLLPGANAAEEAKKASRGKKGADKEEIIRLDPYTVGRGIDLSYSVPTAIRVVHPRVAARYAGERFELKFTIDRLGRPYNLGATDMRADPEMVFPVINAVRAWMFSPARDSDGVPVERKVILPVIIVGVN